MTEEEMVGWHHRLDGHEFESTPGVGDGQGGLLCCSPWGRKESDMTERINCTDRYFSLPVLLLISKRREKIILSSSLAVLIKTQC